MNFVKFTEKEKKTFYFFVTLMSNITYTMTLKFLNKTKLLYLLSTGILYYYIFFFI